MKRAEHGRFGGTVRLPVIEQINHHRNPQRVGEQDELLPLVAAHLTGFGQDFDRLEPLRLGQLHLLDEGVQMADQAQYDLAQARVGRPGKPRQHFGSDIVLGLVARETALSFRHSSDRKSTRLNSSH